MVVNSDREVDGENGDYFGERNINDSVVSGIVVMIAMMRRTLGAYNDNV